MSFYTDMQTVATDLLGEFSQGAVYYVAPGTKTGDDWNQTEAAGTETLIDAVISGVNPRYINGTTIHATDLVAVIGAESITPAMAGRLKVDGKLHQIVMIEPLPAAGTVCAYRVYIRA